MKNVSDFVQTTFTSVNNV